MLSPIIDAMDIKKTLTVASQTIDQIVKGRIKGIEIFRKGMV